MLGNIIDEKYVQLDVEVDNFVDAITQSFTPMREDKIVTQHYIDSVIQIYEETGPYIVISKNIALPHAPVADGAKELALGFTRLKVPLISGHATNDPVKYLFPLSAKDSEEHIELLSKLANLLSDENFINFIGTVDTVQEFINYLKKAEGAKRL